MIPYDKISIIFYGFTAWNTHLTNFWMFCKYDKLYDMSSAKS